MRTSITRACRTGWVRLAHAARRAARAMLAISPHDLARPLVLAAVALATLNAGCADSAATLRDRSASTTLERSKAKRLAEEEQIARAVPSLASIRLERQRPFTLRDSGQNGAMTFVRDVDFRIVGNLGFYIHRLSATLVPTRAGAPIVLDDPTSFRIDVHRGTVTLDDTKLTALFDTYIFGYRDAPLRRLRVSAGDGVIHLQGEMRRGGWVPFALTGTLGIRDGKQLVFRPTDVRVSGIDAGRVMRAANVKLADLLTIDTPVARLTGDDLVMNVGRLMPPPHLNLTITALAATPAGLDLTLDDGSDAGFAMPDGAPHAAMYIRGGDVKFMRSMPMNADILIAPPREPRAGAPFVFDLYHYREQVVAGYFNFRESGAMSITMPSYAGTAAARPPALGTASARLNDSYIAEQQTALRDARRRWDALPPTEDMHAPPGMRRVAFERMPAAPLDERHVSLSVPAIHLHNVDFYIAGGIGFHVGDLDAQLVPKRAGEPVDLDDPHQYDIRILGGSVVVPWAAMSALFNDYLLDYTPRSLNDLKLSPAGKNLRVQGGIKLWNHVPGVWLPADMQGTIDVLDERHLAFTPTEVAVLGVPQAKLLHALGIDLASLTPLSRRGAQLRGNTLVLDQYTVFPPPVLEGRLAHANVEADGLRLTFRRVPDAPLPARPPSSPASYIWMEGGDMKMFDVLELNQRSLIHDSTRTGPMRFDLYGYRGQVSKGSVRMMADGTLLVDLGKRDPLPR